MQKRQAKLIGCLMIASAMAACAHQPGPRGPGGRQGPGQGGSNAASGNVAVTLLFSSFDTNQDLAVSKDELSAGIDRLFKNADLNGDNDISPLEFEDFANKALDGGKSPPFRLDFDRNVDGRITREEFRVEFTAIAQGLDEDHDGVLSHAELLKTLQIKSPKQERGDRDGGQPGGDEQPGGDRGGPPGGGMPPR